jgi:hypothetical protein
MNLRFTSSALIAPMLHSAAGLQALWTDRESFVAFPYLSLDVAIAIRPRLFPGAGLGCVIPAMNFDPPEDRPNEPEFGYVDILINDFSDLNDDIRYAEWRKYGQSPEATTRMATKNQH